MGRRGFVSGSLSGRSLKAVVVVLLAVSLVLPVAVASAKAKPSSPATYPSCATLSVRAIGPLLGIGPLSLKSTVGNLCDFTWPNEGYYQTRLAVEFIPFPVSAAWSAMESSTKAEAKAADGHYGVYSSRVVFWSEMHTSEGLPACTGGEKVTEEGGPECAGQPPENSYEVVGFGKYKSSGLQIIVSAGVAAQPGRTYLSRMIALVTGILSGKIPSR